MQGQRYISTGRQPASKGPYLAIFTSVWCPSDVWASPACADVALTAALKQTIIKYFLANKPTPNKLNTVHNCLYYDNVSNKGIEKVTFTYCPSTGFTVVGHLQCLCVLWEIPKLGRLGLKNGYEVNKYTCKQDAFTSPGNVGYFMNDANYGLCVNVVMYMY